LYVVIDFARVLYHVRSDGEVNDISLSFVEVGVFRGFVSLTGVNMLVVAATRDDRPLATSSTPSRITSRSTSCWANPVATATASPPSTPPVAPNRVPATTGGTDAHTVVISGAAAAYWAADNTNSELMTSTQVRVTSVTTIAPRRLPRAYQKVVSPLHRHMMPNTVVPSRGRS